MTYRLVALDLDGTLMGPDLVIASTVQQAIAATKARGVAVTLATGRPFGATLPFAQQLKIDTPVICYQGALVRHPITGAMLHHVAMPGQYAAEAIEMLQAQNIFVIAYIDEKLCVSAHRPELDFYQTYHPEGAEVVYAPDLVALVRETPPTKLLFITTPDMVAQQTAFFAQHFAGQLSSVRSHELFGELTALHVSKGAALAALASTLGIAQQDVIAIGDHENDLSMIRWAGLGLAMGNAIPAVQDAAKAVLPTVDEAGVAFALQRYVLNETA